MRIRLIAAIAVLVSAAIHLRLWATVFRNQHVVGPAFVVNTVAGVIIVILLLTWRHWIPVLLAFGFGVATLGAFIIAATAGLYGVHEHWRGGYVWTAAISEVVAIVCAVAIAVQEGQAGGARRRSPV